MLIDEDPLGQVKFVRLFKVTMLNLHIIMMKPDIELIISATKGRFSVMAEITRILAANIRRKFFFVVTTRASTRCLVQNF